MIVIQKEEKDGIAQTEIWSIELNEILHYSIWSR